MADVHCYACDDIADFNYGEVTDPRLAFKLSTFGIVVADQKKVCNVIGISMGRANITFFFSFPPKYPPLVFVLQVKEIDTSRIL